MTGHNPLTHFSYSNKSKSQNHLPGITTTTAEKNRSDTPNPCKTSPESARFSKKRWRRKFHSEALHLSSDATNRDRLTSSPELQEGTKTSLDSLPPSLKQSFSRCVRRDTECQISPIAAVSAWPYDPRTLASQATHLDPAPFQPSGRLHRQEQRHPSC